MKALIITFIWVGAALLVFFGAAYASRDKDSDYTYKGKMPGGFKIVIALGAALLLIGIPAAVLTKTTDRMPSGAGTYTLNASTSQIDGRAIFRSTCASCHALSAANARGVYGPDLDKTLGTPGADPKTIAARVESAIKTGGATGKQMPVGLLSGEDAKLVSEYVGDVAGK
ncbi:MAG: c-type cytochrome [Solirubrobacterales bacterium]